MKILIVLIRWKGGVGRVVSSIKPILEKAGYEVEVISREDDLKCYSLKESIFKLRKEVKEEDYPKMIEEIMKKENFQFEEYKKEYGLTNLANKYKEIYK